MHGFRPRRDTHRLIRMAAHWIAALLTSLAAQPSQARPSLRNQTCRRCDRRSGTAVDPYVAVHDGYFSTVGCVEYDRAGAPGHVPYKPGPRASISSTSGSLGPVPDPAKPQVLIYEPDGDKLRLVAAERFIPLATGVKGRPAPLGPVVRRSDDGTPRRWSRWS